MKELVVLTVFLSLMLQCLSQEQVVVALENPEHNILYRGYPNMIIPAVTNNDGHKVELRGDAELSIEKWSDDQKYWVKPVSRKKYAVLHVVLISEGKVDTVRSIQYRLFNLPNPSLYWGGAFNGSKASIKQKLIFAKYPPEISLNATFSVLSWTLFFNNESVSGEGANISKAEELLKTIEQKSIVRIEAVAVGPDGVKRTIEGTWTVVPWSKEIDRNPGMMNCGG